MLPRDIDVLISTEEIQHRIACLGQEITRDYRGKPLVLVGILKGAFVFMADLARNIDLPLTCDFLRVSSYGDSTVSSGVVRFEFDTTQPIQGKDVLLVEDIIDTGLTISFLLENLATRHPSSLKVCSLLFKPKNIKKQVDIHYLGFQIEPHFVIGYGLDLAGRYRNLPYIGVIDEKKVEQYCNDKDQ